MVIPSTFRGKSIVGIASFAFGNCYFSSVTILSSVTTIDHYAFSNCPALTSVTFENTTGWRVNSTNIDVSDAAQNAINLRLEYAFKWWKRY